MSKMASTDVLAEMKNDILTQNDIIPQEIVKAPVRISARFRPALADQLFVGYFKLDRATQTTESEVSDIKELTETVEQLLKEADKLKREITFTRASVASELDAKLQQKSIELYTRSNDRLRELEKEHNEKVDTIRRAFKQQLSDALLQIHSYYSSDYKERLLAERQRESQAIKRVKELERMLKDSQELVESLQEQLRDKELDKVEVVSYESKLSESRELEMLKEELQDLSTELEKLREIIKQKTEQNDELKTEVETLRRQQAILKRTVEQLRADRDLLDRQESQYPTEASQTDLTMATLKAERSQFENEINELKSKLEDIEKSSVANKKPERQRNDESEKIKQLLKEKKHLEELLQMEKRNNEKRRLLDAERSRTNDEGQLRHEIDRLKAELENSNKAWEKKFKILQNSMYVLKEESLLRQQLVRQSVQLNQATIASNFDSPPSSPRKNFSALPKKKDQKTPLPAINRSARRIDHVPFMLDAGETELAYENQICRDDDELPANTIPLPPPPSL